MVYEYILELHTESICKEMYVGCDVLAYVIIAKAVNMQLMETDSVSCR